MRNKLWIKAVTNAFSSLAFIQQSSLLNQQITFICMTNKPVTTTQNIQLIASFIGDDMT